MRHRSHLIKLFSSIDPKLILLAGVLILVVVMQYQLARDWNREEARQREIYLQDFTFLSNLTVAQVAKIQIDNRCILPEIEVDKFVAAVNGIEDFTPNHDLGKVIGVLSITLTSSEVHTFNLVEHQFRGPIIEFFRGDEYNDPVAFAQKGYIEYEIYGTVASSALPQILKGVCNISS